MVNALQLSGSVDELTLEYDRGHRSRMIPVGQPLYIRGWAVDAAAFAVPGSLAVAIDHSIVDATITLGLRRDDIAAIFKSNSLRLSGFEAIVPSHFGTGTHRLDVIWNDGERAGPAICASTTFQAVDSLEPLAIVPRLSGIGVGEVDAIEADGDQRTRAQRAGRNEITMSKDGVIRGWGFDATTNELFQTFGATVDERWFVIGEGGLPRPDVAALRGLPNIVGCGFLVRFATPFFPPGDHAVQVVAQRASGDWVQIGDLQPVEVIEEALPWIWALPELRQPTSAAITDVAFVDEEGRVSEKLGSIPQGHSLFVRGWAVDAPLKASAAAVYLSIDGQRRDALPARYPRRRPSPPGFPAIPGGFTALVPTNELEPGEHCVDLFVVSRNLRGYYVLRNALAFQIHGDNANDDVDLITAGEDGRRRGQSGRLPVREPSPRPRQS